MEKSDSLIKKLENITYLMELVRSEIERATIDSLMDYGTEGGGVEIKDITEENGAVLEGFKAHPDDENGVVIEFKDGRKMPLFQYETDTMYDIFVRIHSDLLEESLD